MSAQLIKFKPEWLDENGLLTGIAKDPEIIAIANEFLKIERRGMRFGRKVLLGKFNRDIYNTRVNVYGVPGPAYIRRIPAGAGLFQNRFDQVRFAVVIGRAGADPYIRVVHDVICACAYRELDEREGEPTYYTVDMAALIPGTASITGTYASIKLGEAIVEANNVMSPPAENAIMMYQAFTGRDGVVKYYPGYYTLSHLESFINRKYFEKMYNKKDAGGLMPTALGIALLDFLPMLNRKLASDVGVSFRKDTSPGEPIVFDTIEPLEYPVTAPQKTTWKIRTYTIGTLSYTAEVSPPELLKLWYEVSDYEDGTMTEAQGMYFFNWFAMFALPRYKEVWKSREGKIMHANERRLERQIADGSDEMAEE